MVAPALVSLLASGFSAPQEVIDLPVEDTRLCADFEEHFRIDDDLSKVTSVGFDQYGNVRIGDFSPSGGLRVVVVNPDGQRSEFGFEGPGPGEFAGAWRIVALADGRTVVPDPVPGVFHIFLADGRFSHQVRSLGIESEMTFKADRGGGLLAQVKAVDSLVLDSTIFSTTTSLVEGPLQVTRVFLDADEAHTEVFTHGWTPPRPGFTLDFAMGGFTEGNVTASGTLNRVALLPRFLWDVIPGGGVSFADSSGYAIKITGPSGDVVRVLRRALPPRPITASVRRTYRRYELDALSAQMDDRRRRAPSQILGFLQGTEDMQRRAIEEMEFADEVPLVDDLVTTWDGTIWVRRTPDDGFPFDPSSDPLSNGGVDELQQQLMARGPASIDVVTSTGEYIGTLLAGEARLPAAFGPGGVAAYIEVGALDVPVVRVGRVSIARACGQEQQDGEQQDGMD